MSELLDKYLNASEVRRITPSTFLRRERIDFARYYGALMSELQQEVTAGHVVAVASKGGSTAYLEVIE